VRVSPATRTYESPSGQPPSVASVHSQASTSSTSIPAPRRIASRATPSEPALRPLSAAQPPEAAALVEAASGTRRAMTTVLRPAQTSFCASVGASLVVRVGPEEAPARRRGTTRTRVSAVRSGASSRPPRRAARGRLAAERSRLEARTGGGLGAVRGVRRVRAHGRSERRHGGALRRPRHARETEQRRVSDGLCASSLGGRCGLSGRPHRARRGSEALSAVATWPLGWGEPSGNALRAAARLGARLVPPRSHTFQAKLTPSDSLAVSADGSVPNGAAVGCAATHRATRRQRPPRGTPAPPANAYEITDRRAEPLLSFRRKSSPPGAKRRDGRTRVVVRVRGQRHRFLLPVGTL
jgi:hypothetical protein